MLFLRHWLGDLQHLMCILTRSRYCSHILAEPLIARTKWYNAEVPRDLPRLVAEGLLSRVVDTRGHRLIIAFVFQGTLLVVVEPLSCVP